MIKIVRVFGYAALICFSIACWVCGWPVYMSLVFQGFFIGSAGFVEFCLWKSTVDDYVVIEAARRGIPWAPPRKP